MIVGSTTQSPSLHTTDRVDEHRGREDPFLEQVADALGVRVEKPQGVARFDVLGQHEHRDVGMVAPDLFRGDEPFIGMRWRHADVDDGDVG